MINLQTCYGECHWDGHQDNKNPLYLKAAEPGHAINISYIQSIHTNQ